MPIGRSYKRNQFYSSIFVATYKSCEIICDEQKYIFRKLNDQILANPKGIIMDNGQNVASPERAFLEMIYLHPNYYFDNLSPLNWDNVYDLTTIFPDKSKIEHTIKSYHEHFLKDL